MRVEPGYGIANLRFGATKGHGSKRHATTRQFMAIAHRGAQFQVAKNEDGKPTDATVYPENELPAFIQAARLAKDARKLNTGSHGKAALKVKPAIELDVIATRPEKEGQEGKLVVTHDDGWGRIYTVPTREYMVKKTPYSSIQRAEYQPGNHQQPIQQTMAAMGIQNVSFVPAHKVPTLDEVMTQVLAENPKMHFYIELKTSDNTYPTSNNRLEELVVKQIKRLEGKLGKSLRRQITIIGFNPWTLLKVKMLEPKLQTAWDVVLGDYKYHTTMPDLMRFAKKTLKVSAILPPYEETTPDVVNAAHKAGLKVMPWVSADSVAEEEDYIQKLFNLGVDGLISNFYKHLLNFLGQQGGKVQ